MMYAYQNNISSTTLDNKSFRTINLSSDKVLTYILYLIELIVSIQNLKHLLNNSDEEEK